MQLKLNLNPNAYFLLKDFVIDRVILGDIYSVDFPELYKNYLEFIYKVKIDWCQALPDSTFWGL